MKTVSFGGGAVMHVTEGAELRFDGQVFFPHFCHNRIFRFFSGYKI